MDAIRIPLPFALSGSCQLFIFASCRVIFSMLVAIETCCGVSRKVRAVYNRSLILLSERTGGKLRANS